MCALISSFSTLDSDMKCEWTVAKKEVTMSSFLGRECFQLDVSRDCDSYDIVLKLTDKAGVLDDICKTDKVLDDPEERERKCSRERLLFVYVYIFCVPFSLFLYTCICCYLSTCCVSSVFY